MRRDEGDDFRPSRNLVLEAVLRRKTTIVHVWNGGPSAGGADYTLAGSFDWAFCSPLLSEACKDWGIYVTGRFSGSQAATFLAPG